MSTMHERWPRIAPLFHQAVALEPTERDQFLAEHCQGDDGLRRQVEELLAADRDVSASWPGLALPDSHEVEARAVDSRERNANGSGRKPLADSIPIVQGYQDLQRLGRGGMGTVYRACRRDRVFAGKIFAIKVMHAHRVSARSKRRFDTERRLLADLDHPSIVRLYDGGELGDGRPFLVMDYIEGRPLDLYCREERLTIERRLRLFTKICGALHYAHQNLVVHRDLKPSNILVDADDSPRLLDFGIAKRLYDTDGSQETTGWLVPMTPAYASPEQIGGESVTTASDLYTLGLVLFELLVGRLPEPPGRQQAERPEPPRLVADVTPAQAAVCRTTLPRLRRQLAGDLDHIVAKALRVEPGARYASARELAEDIERHLSARPVLARRGSWRYLAGRFLRRHRLGVAIACSALLVLVLGLAAGIQSNRLLAAQAAGAQSERLIRRLVGPETDLLMAEGDLDEAVAEIVGLDLSDEEKMTLFDVFRRMHIPDDTLVDQGISLLREQLASAQQARPWASGEEPVGLSEVALILGKLINHRGRFAQAEELLGDARRLVTAIQGGEDIALAPYLEAHASALSQLERYEEGIVALEHSVRLRRADTDSTADEVEPLTGLATLFYLQGSFQKSAEACREAMTILGPGGGEDPILYAAALSNLSVALKELDASDPTGEAEASARESLALRIAHLGPSHRETFNARNNLAVVVGSAGKVIESLAISLEILEHAEVAFGRDHHHLGYVLTSIARAYHELDEWEACVAYSRRAVALREKRLPPDSWLTAISQARLGDCLGDVGAHAEAISVLRRSIDVFERSKVEDSQWLDAARIRLEELLAGPSMAGVAP